MKKYIITAFAFITLLTGSVTFTACEDIDDIKELNLDRLLSPTNLTARVRDKVNIELTWDEMDRAQSYVIEVFKEDPDFTGTAISTLESEKATYTVTGLEGETSYSIRVKSVAEGITDSKWVSATRSTDAEQILLEVAEEDLTASEVTLRWPAGQVATEIIITPNDVAAHRVTSDEIAAGAATIKNLKSETTYTATLKNGDKTRGTMVFTTLINLDGALPAYPGDNLATIIATAEANATIVLLPKDDNNSFIYTDESGTAKTLEIELTKDVTIKGLYARRWGIETSFRDLKYTVGMLDFHFKKVMCIHQEIYAHLIMYNFAEMITSHIVIEKKQRKYTYKANFSIAAHMCRLFYRGKATSPNLETIIARHIIPVRNDRHRKRNLTIKVFHGFLYRVA